MTTFHAVVWMDHTQAHVLMFDKEHVEAQRIKARHQHTPKHGNVGPDKDFFKAIATTLEGVTEVLLTGPANAKIEFRDWCKHNAHAVDRSVVDVVNTDHPTDAQVVAMARQYFVAPANSSTPHRPRCAPCADASDGQCKPARSV